MGQRCASLLLIAAALTAAEVPLRKRLAAFRVGQPLGQAWRVVQDLRGNDDNHVCQRFGSYGTWIACGQTSFRWYDLRWQVRAEWGVVVMVLVQAEYLPWLYQLPDVPRRWMAYMPANRVVRYEQEVQPLADTVAAITQLDLPDEEPVPDP